MITNLISQETQILQPIRLQEVRPVTELSFVPPQLRHRTELAVSEVGMRLSAADTERLMADIQKSVATASDSDTGLTQFGGTMRHPDFGAVHVRGRGAVHGNELRAEGCFEFNPRVLEAEFPQRLIFLIEKFSMPEADVEQIMMIYERAIAGADRAMIHKITREFSEVFAVVAKELEDDGKLVMFVTAPGDSVSVSEEAARIVKVNIATRILSKLAFKIDQLKGNRVGEFGVRIPKEADESGRMPKVRALLTA